MMDETGLPTITDLLLQPLPGGDPAGRWLRYERAYMELAKSREEDDPALPLGEWERPLVKADWRQVAADCERLLREQSKDFQIAGWLCDAWIRLYRMEGLCAGLSLLKGLAERYWLTAWPALEDGDPDRRVAPFIWLNSSLPLTLKLQVRLLQADLQREQPLTLLDWERASTRDDGKSDPKAEAAAVPSRQAIRASVRPSDGEPLRELTQLAADAAASLRALSALLDEKLKQASPSLARLQATVDAVGAAADSLLAEIPAAAPPQAAASPATVPADAVSAPASAMAAATPSVSSPSNGFADREHAYQVLEAAARYLASVEPHSPTPFLVMRAVQLGRMSLPDMLREVSADAGSLDKFFSLLGIAPTR